MNWNLFWALWFMVFAAICWISAYIFGFKKLRLSKLCSSHTEGKVVKYSSVNYSGIHIPLVKYTVDGKTYKISGPRFSGAIVKKINTPFKNLNTKIETNLTTRKNLPKKLKVKIYINSLASISISPLEKLYPVDSSVDVYYNPDKPKEAFVQRHEGIHVWLVALIVFFAVLSTIGFFIVITGPKIIM